jgi:hypothetical protein
VKDNLGAAVANATVSGNFSTGGSGSCLTGATGLCTLTSGAISRSIPSSKWTLSGISAALAWDRVGQEVSITRPF